MNGETVTSRTSDTKALFSCQSCANPVRASDAYLCRRCDSEVFEAAAYGPIALGKFLSQEIRRRSGCAKCNGVGYVEGPDRRGHPCACRLAEFATERAQFTGLPKHFWNVEPMALAGHASAYLFGVTGSGKTTRAAMAVKARVTLPGEVRFISVTQLDEDRKLAIKEDRRDPLTDVRNAAYLVLDDLGKERIGKYQFEALWSIVDHRYANDLPLVITSEHGLAKLWQRVDGSDSDMAPGRALVRRIRAMCGDRFFRCRMEGQRSVEFKAEVE